MLTPLLSDTSQGIGRPRKRRKSLLLGENPVVVLLSANSAAS